MNSPAGDPVASTFRPVASTFRDVMSRVCTPVSVITALDGTRPHGTTVSAFSSLSMDPPMVLVSLDRGSDLLAIVRDNGRFGVNVLAHHQSDLALQFARKGPDKFTDVNWEIAAEVPRLQGVSGWLSCSVSTLVEGGDHIVVLGEVTDTHSQIAAPLTYHDRAFGTHSTLEAALR